MINDNRLYYFSLGIDNLKLDNAIGSQTIIPLQSKLECD